MYYYIKSKNKIVPGSFCSHPTQSGIIFSNPGARFLGTCNQNKSVQNRHVVKNLGLTSVGFKVLNERNGPFAASGHMVQNPSTGTPRTKRLLQDKFAFSLFWMSQCVACSPAWWILYHVTASCKGPIKSRECFQTCCNSIS